MRRQRSSSPQAVLLASALALLMSTSIPGCNPGASPEEGGPGTGGAGPDGAVMWPSPFVRAIAGFAGEDGARYAVFGGKATDGFPEAVEAIVVSLPDGVEIACEYDADGRLTRMSLTDGHLAEFTWDGNEGGVARFYAPDGSELGSLPFQGGGEAAGTSKPAHGAKGLQAARGPGNPRAEDVYDTIELVCAGSGEVINNVMMTVAVYCGQHRMDYWPSRPLGRLSVRRPRSYGGGDVPGWTDAVQGVLDLVAKAPSVTFQAACVPLLMSIPLDPITANLVCQGLGVGVKAASRWQVVRQFATSRPFDCSTVTYRVSVRRAQGDPWIAWEVDQAESTFTVDEDAPPAPFTVGATCPGVDVGADWSVSLGPDIVIYYPDCVRESQCIRWVSGQVCPHGYYIRYGLYLYQEGSALQVSQVAGVAWGNCFEVTPIVELTGLHLDTPGTYSATLELRGTVYVGLVEGETRRDTINVVLVVSAP